MLLRNTICFLLLFILKESDLVSSKRQCIGQAANIIFVMDSSSSIWQFDYLKQLKFVQNLVDHFDIGADGNAVRVGAITFSNKAHLEFSIDQYNTREDIKAAVGRIPYRTGVTNTAIALKLVRSEIEEKRKLYNAPFIVVVITDGQSRHPEATRKNANILHELGVHVYAIGVGHNYDLDELKAIASDPVENVYQVSNYSALQGIVKLFGAKTCKDLISSSATEQPTTTTVQSTKPPPTTTTVQSTKPPLTTSTTISTKIPITTAPTTQPPTRTEIPDFKDDIMLKDEPTDKKATHTISFGFDLVSVGISQANLIFQFISSILPLNYYGHFSIISEYGCLGMKTGLKGLNIPLMPVTNKTIIDTTNSIKWHLPGLVSIIHQLSSNLYKRILNNAYKGVMGYEVTVLFVDSSLTKLTSELIKNVESLKRLGSKVYVIDVGQGKWAEPKLLEAMSSQPPKRYTFKVPTYKQLLDKKRLPLYKFLANCGC